MEKDALYIDLSSITKAEGAVLDVNKTYPKEAFYEVERTLPLASDVVLCGNITNLSGNLFLKGTVSFLLSFACDRCLDDFTKEFCLEIDEVIAKENSDFEADEYISYAGNKVFLVEAIFKYIYQLTLEKHICKDDCKGLCSKCGLNLNFKTCDCTDDEIDPRLEKLKDFFKN